MLGFAILVGVSTSTLPIRPLRVGSHEAAVPVVLAPMAGVTNAAFRKLCRSYGGGFYVSEMITSRALVERNRETMRLIRFEADEQPRSIQLYTTDPDTVAAAVRRIVEEDLADHIDLNFGCPVPKVTRKGGGAALPWKHALFTSIVRAAVGAAAHGDLPVTVKMRKGIDDDHLTYLDAARAAEQEGVAWVALHARTAADYYSGSADWDAIARLKQAVTSIPVLGNGDIWSAGDAIEMVARTGCDGVVVGRGCLGRPWLFADLEAAFTGSSERVRLSLGEVAEVMMRHAEMLVEHHGDEGAGCREFRKHVAWYLKGYPAGGELRFALANINTLSDLSQLLSTVDATATAGDDAEGARGRQGTPKRVVLPEGWLASREIGDAASKMLSDAELSNSGG
jgi:nifR3 family TIM-barrel protein